MAIPQKPKMKPNDEHPNGNQRHGNMEQLQERAYALRLSGLLARWDQVVCDSARLAWVTELLGSEETERDQRSLECRMRSGAHWQV
jgi:hypothetical protein